MNIIFDQDDQRHQQIDVNIQDPIQLTHPILRQQVDIQLSHGISRIHENSSIFEQNQIFSQPIIDHKWESRYYSGHLVATSRNFVAYALKPQSGDDIVCIFYKQADYRSVINPPFTGDIHDLAFSFSDDLLLSCVDQASHLRIYRIEKIDEANEIEHTLIVFVDLNYSNSQCPPTVSWCCFIPDSGEDDDNGYTMMSVTRGSEVEVINVDIVSQSYPSDSILMLDQIESGHLNYSDNKGNVTCVCFSPDGTALGTATDQGEIKFFSISFDQPIACRCLHVWIPHEGRPISFLCFLDDHENLTQDTQLWRYAISGCDQNRELKVWSCSNWTCLQTIRFQYTLIDSAFHPSAPFPILQASIDLSSRFLVLSDIHRNCFYVLTVYQHSKDNRAFFSSINAFSTIQSPSLSFAIIAADQLTMTTNQPEVLSSFALEHNNKSYYAIKLYSIHSKCFQEILLAFKTNSFAEEDQLRPNQNQNDFYFEPYLKFLQIQGTSTKSNPIGNNSVLIQTCRIDDLLTPAVSLNNREMSHALNTNENTLPTLDPLHGLLLGNTTAFDTVPTQDDDTVDQASPGTAGMTRTLFDVDDKNIVQKLTGPTSSFPIDLTENQNDEVFLPLNGERNDQSTNSTLLSPSKFADNSRWNKNVPEIDNFSDPTETSDKDEDSTADEEKFHHSRPKRRSGRSPTTSHDTLHEIRQLTQLLNEFQNSRGQLTSDSSRLGFDYDEKLEQCCQRLDHLTSKVDRLINFEQTSGVVIRPNRPSPHSVPIEILTSNERSTTLSDVSYDQIESILIEKIQVYLQTAMQSVFEPYHQLKDTMHKDLVAKLLATDTVVKQAVSQIFRSKNMIDGISQTINHSIQSSLVVTYRDTFNQWVIPSFEKAVTNMFQQTNDVFKRGTKEYLQEMIEYSRQQQRSIMQQREQMMTDIRKESAQINKELEKKIQDLVSNLKADLNRYLIDQLTPVIRERIRSTVREETTELFRELLSNQKREIESLLNPVTPKPVERSTTPAMPSTKDLNHQHVVRLIRQGHLNQAFEYALSASDLSLVLFVCETLPPNELFAIQPCPLQTPVLLSLIQQLSADFNHQQELKFRYLSEALICLDLLHPSSRDFLQSVLADLSKKLVIFMQTNPNSSINKRFQILLMTSQGLLQKLAQQRTTPIIIK